MTTDDLMDLFGPTVKWTWTRTLCVNWPLNAPFSWYFEFLIVSSQILYLRAIKRYRYSPFCSMPLLRYIPLAEGFGNLHVRTCCDIEKSFLERSYLPFNWWHIYFWCQWPGIYSSRILFFHWQWKTQFHSSLFHHQPWAQRRATTEVSKSAGASLSSGFLVILGTWNIVSIF